MFALIFLELKAQFLPDWPIDSLSADTWTTASLLDIAYTFAHTRQHILQEQTQTTAFVKKKKVTIKHYCPCTAKWNSLTQSVDTFDRDCKTDTVTLVVNCSISITRQQIAQAPNQPAFPSISSTSALDISQ